MTVIKDRLKTFMQNNILRFFKIELLQSNLRKCKFQLKIFLTDFLILFCSNVFSSQKTVSSKLP